MKRTASAGLLFLAALGACTDAVPPLPGTSTYFVRVTKVNDVAQLDADGLPRNDLTPLPANKGDVEEVWDFEIEARSPFGDPVLMDGEVRISVEPGVVINVVGDGAVGRNIPLVKGKAKGTAKVTAVYGNARLWVEDLGYVPVPLSDKPKCSNGKDDNGDGLIDFPADPGCAFADDNTEDGGTFAAGTSQPVRYSFPRVNDIQGNGATTPYPYEALQIETEGPKPVVVTRVASDGFYVTDLSEQANGYNHIFAFNFSAPVGMRVCDQLTYFSGTVVEFFGFTELSFPSFKLSKIQAGDACELMPTPTVLDEATINDPVAMEKLESSLVRIEGFKVAEIFGPKPVVSQLLTPDRPENSSCDLNGDGQVDFESLDEGQCSENCSDAPAKDGATCTEWTAYAARGNFTAYIGTTKIQINTGTASEFDPVANKGVKLTSLTGTLRNFSGGSLNWTIETRCPDDLVCDKPGCAKEDLPPTKACIRPRTIGDADQGTN